MRKSTPIQVAYTKFLATHEGAVIAFDIGDGRFLFYKGSAVIASRLASEPMSKGTDGAVEVILSKERTDAVRKQVEELGHEFLMLVHAEHGSAWKIETGDQHCLERFVKVHTLVFEEALGEIKDGEKCGHWMWYIFPQLKGLGKSETSELYGIANLSEAKSFLSHPYLGKNLITITKTLLDHAGKKSAVEIFGTVDAMKLKSSMTLFALCRSSSGNVFERVLAEFFNGKKDEVTLKMLGWSGDDLQV